MSMVHEKLDDKLRTAIRQYGFEQVNQTLKEVGLARLEEALCLMIQEYGFEQVDRSLNEIGISDHQSRGSNRDMSPLNRVSVTKAERKRTRVTAPEYATKMQLPVEKEAAVIELASRFHDKSFLPTFGDIANFCRTYGIAEPASKSRASAIPRVFKFIATMDADEIQRMLNEGMFSGPARLRPIADAIRRTGRARRATENALSE